MAVLCPECGEKNTLGSVRCWQCHAFLAPKKVDSEAHSPHGDGRVGASIAFILLIWAVVFVGWLLFDQIGSERIWRWPWIVLGPVVLPQMWWGMYRLSLWLGDMVFHERNAPPQYRPLDEFRGMAGTLFASVLATQILIVPSAQASDAALWSHACDGYGASGLTSRINPPCSDIEALQEAPWPSIWMLVVLTGLLLLDQRRRWIDIAENLKLLPAVIGFGLLLGGFGRIVVYLFSGLAADSYMNWGFAILALGALSLAPYWRMMTTAEKSLASRTVDETTRRARADALMEAEIAERLREKNAADGMGEEDSRT